MNSELSAALGFTAAGGVSLLATPLAIRIARRAAFYDHPREYRQHAAPTPFLGGAAVLIAFLVAAAFVGAASGRLLVPLSCAVALWLLGTLDDRVAVAPKWRLLAAAGAAIALSEAGLGWDTSAGGAIDVLLTVLWIVGLVNAFNLMDNLDGACGTVAAVAAAGIGALAAIKGQAAVAGLAFALSGACAGFLPWNLAGPAKVFLGDGGSMPVGFLVAALAMATARYAHDGNAGILVGALLVGLTILDTTLVSVSRMRRGVSLATGGRDHLTHRILLVLRSPRLVVGALALVQGLLCSFAIVGYELGSVAVVGLAFVAFTAGVVAILVLDTARWRPVGIAVAEAPHQAQAVPTQPAAVDSG